MMFFSKLLKYPVTYALAAGLFMAGFATTASASSVFLNGQEITGLKNKTLKGVDVQFDKFGNIHITAKGIRVKGASTKTPEDAGFVAGAAPTKRYFLVTEKAAPGMSQYDLDIFINAKWVKKLRDVEQHMVVELTQHLKQGPNKIRIVAKKNYGSVGRRSQSPKHFFRLVIGEGESGGRNVMITKRAVDYKRTAQETTDFSDEYTITVY